MSPKSKMMGCRVPNELDQEIRERAENENRSVNDLMVEILSNNFEGSPERGVTNFSSKTLEITQKVRELKSQIAALKKSDNSFWGDEDVELCITAIEVEVKKLIDTLPKPVKEKDFWDE